MGNDPIGGIENRRRGPIILLQAHHLGSTEVIAEGADVLNAGTSPAIDGLIVITHDGNGYFVTGQHLQPGVLNAIGILELVH